MKIEYLRYQNFLSVGDTSVEVDFTKLGPVTLIKGQNFDFHDKNDHELEFSTEEDEHHSNGAGKSTCAEAIVYGFYGSTIRKRMSHTDIINSTNKKKLEVEVIFSINNTRYRILRTRKPDTLRLWEGGDSWTDENEITKGGQPATQKHIESIIKMNHKAFVNIVCFGQHNDYNFLECKPEDQRLIAESLLGLEVCNDYLSTAKEEVKSLKTELKLLVVEYDSLINQKRVFENRVAQIEVEEKEWFKSCERQIQNLKSQIINLQNQLGESDIGAALVVYEEAQSEILKLKDYIPNLESRQTQIDQAINDLKSKQSALNEKRYGLTLEIKSLQQDANNEQKVINKSNEDIEGLKNLKEGAKCPHCYGVIDPTHYKHIIALNDNKVSSALEKKKIIGLKISGKQDEIAKVDADIEKAKQIFNMADEKRLAVNQSLLKSQSRISQLSKIKAPDLSTKELLLQEKIEQVRELLTQKEKEIEAGSPYISILISSKKDLNDVIERTDDQKSKIATIEDALPYYEYWIKAFGDDGIRAYILERVIPIINNRITYWLHYLINNKLSVKFDKHLNVVIKNPSDAATSFFGTCGGEQMRINLAISQAFAYATMMSSGTWPSIVFLDEVSDSIDKRGIKSIYKTICELSGEKQVMVITHNNDLREMLQSADTITMVKKNGFTERKAG